MSLTADDFTDHEIGAVDCGGCWFGRSEECEADHGDCRVHTEFGDENWDGYWLRRRHEADYRAPPSPDTQEEPIR